MNKKELTILITNYNTADFIELLLYSLIKLTKRPFNVIINDNGSSAKEIKRLLNLAKEYSNVYLHCDYKKAKDILGWVPQYTIKKGLEKIYHYYLNG